MMGVLAGCATGTVEMRRHPDQARLERLLAAVLPHTDDPGQHYWVRVIEPAKHHVGLAILPQRHIVLSQPLLEQADDEILTALIAHGVAHHQLHHYGKRQVVETVQQVAFKVGGFFVPGLGYGKYATSPMTELALSAGQEPSADRGTVQSLTRMGLSSEVWIRTLEFLVEHGYAERVGRITMREEELLSRVTPWRKSSAPDAPPTDGP